MNSDRIPELEELNRRMQEELEKVRSLADALEKERNNYRSMLDTAEGFAVYQLAMESDRKSGAKVVFVSPSIKDVLGVEDPLDFKSWFERIHPADRERVEKGNRLSRLERIPFNEEVRIYNPAKESWRHIHAISKPVFDDNGTLGHFNGLLVDVTDQKKAEIALRESEERYRGAFEQAGVGIRISQNGVLVYVNPKFVKMYGYDEPEEILGKPVELLAVPEEREKVLKRQSERLAGKDVRSHYELTAMKKNGERFDVEVWLTLIKYNEKPAILAFVLDIGAEKKLKQQLFRAQKMEAIGALAGGIAHDFNNILAAIMGYTELAGLYVPKNSAMRRNLEQVMKASQRAKDLIGHILAFSRQVEKERRPVHVGPIVKETTNLLKATLPATIEIRHDIDCDLDPVFGDPSQIHQVLLNLCTNAAHAMRGKSGILSVSMKSVKINGSPENKALNLDAGKYLKLSVSDTGSGIPKEIVDRVFEPYFTTKGKGEGTGLGLSMVHGIVADYRGTVTVYSEPGLGSTFNVYLPVIEKKIVETEKNQQQSLPTGNERILIVDDELVLVNLEKQLLEHLGYEVDICASSPEALETFEKDPARYDLVITDLTMPKITGDELAARMTRIRPDIPVVLCSGYPERITEVKATHPEIKAFLQKPLVIGELAEAVRRTLDDLK